MNTLNELLENDITKEQIDKIFIKAATENAMDLNLKYASAIDEYFYDNPKSEDLLPGYLLVSICVAYTTAMESIKTVLCELLGIEDTTAAGEEDKQAEQSE